MTQTAVKTPLELLEEKMVAEIENGHPYEALQLAQSLIARKKKTLGRDVTASLVGHGAAVLLKGKAPADAGTLIAWYIEDGAGDDYYFRLQEDLSIISDLFNEAQPKDIHPLLQKIYGPLHKLIAKSSNAKTVTATKLQELEQKFIDIFVVQKDWNVAVRALLRIDQIPRVAQILDLWAKDEGYTSEYSLFFARVVLQLLSDTQLAKANALLQASYPYLNPLDKAPEGDISEDKAAIATANSLAVWHLTIILTELAGAEAKPRVDKNKIFLILLERYTHIIQKLDPKLLYSLDKIGQSYFGLNAGDNQVNPMAAMFQNMMAGGGAAPAAASAPGKKA